MRAIIAEEGKPLSLADIDKPAIGPRDVLIAVRAAGLNLSLIHI